MISTVQSLALLLVVIIPGAVASFGYERHVGPVGRDTTERLLRYVVGTALMAPFSLGVAWLVWTRLLHTSNGGNPPTFTNRLVEGDDVSAAWLLLPLPYILVPSLLGSLVGVVRTRYYRWALSNGADDVPPVGWWSRLGHKWRSSRSANVPVYMTGWDVLFLDPGPKLVTVRMKDGNWIGGLFGAGSYASPPASTVKEMVLEARIRVGHDGAVSMDELGTPEVIDGAVRVVASDVDIIIVRKG